MAPLILAASSFSFRLPDTLAITHLLKLKKRVYTPRLLQLFIHKPAGAFSGRNGEEQAFPLLCEPIITKKNSASSQKAFLH